MWEQATLDSGKGVSWAPALVLSAHYGNNDVLISNAARLYIPDGAVVLDCTWGKGNFWPRTDTRRFRLVGTDLHSGTARADFKRLPFKASSCDVCVFDPPYVHSTTQPRDIYSQYRNNETTPGKTYAAIMDLYRAGMGEACRVVRPGGQIWVKCQDTVEGRRQQWSVVNVHAAGLELGLYPRDMFVLVAPSPPGRSSAARQFHARRNHSYLWVFDR